MLTADAVLNFSSKHARSGAPERLISYTTPMMHSYAGASDGGNRTTPTMFRPIHTLARVECEETAGTTVRKRRVVMLAGSFVARLEPGRLPITPLFGKLPTTRTRGNRKDPGKPGRDVMERTHIIHEEGVWN